MAAGIDIVRGDELVARLNWIGARMSGRGRVVSSAEHRQTARQIRNAMRDRRDLNRVQFTTDGGQTPGWRGFDGVLNGLLVTLPSLGLDVGEIIWPDQS